MAEEIKYKIAKWFLSASNWALFLLIFILPLAIIVPSFFMPAYFLNGAHFFFAPGIALVICEVAIYLWMWSVGNTYYKMAGFNNLFSNRVFRFFVWIPVLVSLLFLIFWISGTSMLGMGRLSIANMLTGALLFLIPLELLFMVGKFYCFYFTSKVIKSAENREIAKFDDFISEFILLLLFPIGIWFIQPRINKLFKGLKDK